MTINLYRSDPRIKDLLFQIDPDLLQEETSKTDKELVVKGEVKGGVPTWLGFFGFTGEATAGGEGKIVFSKEIKPLGTEYYLLAMLKKIILKNDFTHLDSATAFAHVASNRGVFRVKGLFRMLVPGQSGMERVMNFDNAKMVEWEGVFQDFKVRFATTPGSYVARTAVYQILSRPECSATVDFFGILTHTNHKTDAGGENIFELLPLFFGVEYDL